MPTQHLALIFVLCPYGSKVKYTADLAEMAATMDKDDRRREGQKNSTFSLPWGRNVVRDVNI